MKSLERNVSNVKTKTVLHAAGTPAECKKAPVYALGAQQRGRKA